MNKKEITRTCASVDEYVFKLQMDGYNVMGFAFNMFENITIQKTDERHLTLVKVTPKDLGLTEKTSAYKILAAAEKKGLELCPPWVGF